MDEINYQEVACPNKKINTSFWDIIYCLLKTEMGYGNHCVIEKNSE